MSILTRIQQSLKYHSLVLFRNVYNFIRAPKRMVPLLSNDLVELNEIYARTRRGTDISDFLPLLFYEAMTQRPKLIVELGVRGGESTFVFERAAQLCDATLLSVDIEPAGQLSDYPKWHFVEVDDVEFSNRFADWCQGKGVTSQIDLLFIDTSHLYEHTLQEITHWFPFLAPQAKVIFHDTNLKQFMFRKNGQLYLGWNNNRGVIRALEEHLGTTFSENQEFIQAAQGFIIHHLPYSSGLTILRKI